MPAKIDFTPFKKPILPKAEDNLQSSSTLALPNNLNDSKDSKQEIAQAYDKLTIEDLKSAKKSKKHEKLSLNELKKAKRRQSWSIAKVLTGLILLITAIVGGVSAISYYNIYKVPAQYDPTTYYQKLIVKIKQSNSDEVKTISEYQQCIIDGGVLGELKQAKFCTISSITYLQGLSEEGVAKLQSMNLEESEETKHNQLILKPLNANDLTSFRNGSDLGGTMIPGAVVYSANTNSDSTFYGYMHILNTGFSSIKPEQRTQLEELNKFIAGSDPYNRGFAKLFYTSTTAVNRNQDIISDLTETVKTDQLLSTFGEVPYKTLLIYKDTLTDNPQFNIQVFLQVGSNNILLEEAFNQAKNKALVDGSVAKCKAQNSELTALRDCIASEISASKETLDYIKTLQDNLLTKFRIK